MEATDPGAPDDIARRRRGPRWLLPALVALAVSLGITRASASAQVLERRELSAATATLQFDHAEESEVREVTLPYHWDRSHPGKGGQARFHIPFDLARVPEVPLYLYIPRIGNTYEIRLNGRIVQHEGDPDLPNGANTARQPRKLTLPANLFEESNLLEVRIRADLGRGAGLSRMLLGPRPLIAPLFDADDFRRVTVPTAIAVFSLVAGLVALALWATQVAPAPAGRSRRDPLYLYAGLAELAWAVRVSDVLVETPPVPWPWWGIVQVAALCAAAAGMALFCMEMAGWHASRGAWRFRRWLALLFLASIPVSALALTRGWPTALTLGYGTLAISFLGFGLAYFTHVFRAGSPPSHRVVAIAIMAAVLVGMRDLYAFRISTSYEGGPLLRYTALAFGIVLAYIVLARFREVSLQASDLTRTLARRIAEREAELARSYAEMEELARERALAQERSRILRDMHDGVGTHLSAAIRQLEGGLAQPEELLQTMRDSMDQLKLSIDAVTMAAGDVGALLASLRYRLEPRLRSAGIELRWQVALLPVLPELDGQRMRQLQYVLYEALSNVLQHAQAGTVSITAGPVGGGIELRIVDDGRGFLPESKPGQGLRSMRERCKAIGARIDFRSEPGRTEILIRLGPTLDPTTPPASSPRSRR